MARSADLSGRLSDQAITRYAQRELSAVVPGRVYTIKIMTRRARIDRISEDQLRAATHSGVRGDSERSTTAAQIRLTRCAKKPDCRALAEPYPGRITRSHPIASRPVNPRRRITYTAISVPVRPQPPIPLLRRPGAQTRPRW